MKRFDHFRLTPLSAFGFLLPAVLGASCSPSHQAKAQIQPADGTVDDGAATIIPIGRVQGAVGTSRGTAHQSPFVQRKTGAVRAARQSVTVQGVIYAKTLSRDAKNGETHGFFVQNTPATADADADTSDGIYVFLGRFSKFKEGYEPKIGDEIVLRGEASEYFNQTQLSRPFLVRRVRGSVGLDAEVAPFEVNPPDDLEEANRYWERHEGMRARVPAGSVAMSGRHDFGGDAEAWFARSNTTIAKRPEVYARRAFRDTHPLDNVPAQGFDDGNGYRFCIGSQALKGAADQQEPLIAPVRTFDTLTQPVTGGVSYSFGKYALEAETQLALRPGADPSLNAPPTAPGRATQYSVATYNVENLYDFRDDPNDPNDFAGNPGSPGVKPPFDYVPASTQEYQNHLRKLAGQIVSDLHAPDVVMLEEIEDQDVCSTQDGELSCGTSDNKDGKPDTAQELALAIAQAGGPQYEAAYDRDGTDARGITCAFLYRRDRVELATPKANDPLLGSTPQVVGFAAGMSFNTQVQNPKCLNAPLGTVEERDNESAANGIFTRAPQVVLFRIFRQKVGIGQALPLYAIANHFSSRPDQRVAQRRQQAAYLAALVQTLQKADAQARVVAGGDLNVFPRPDDPFTPSERAKPSDQLGPLYDAGLLNLWDVLVKQTPASAYSYVYNGQAQTLDHLWNTAKLRSELAGVGVAHVNSDWPDGAADSAAAARRASDHDPVVARYKFP